MFDLDAMPKSILTLGNPKTAKGEKFGVLTAILHLAPAHVSGQNVCPHSTPGCVAACLNTAGRGGIGLDADGLNTIQAARIQRTRYFQRDRAGYMLALVADIVRVRRSADRHGLTLAVRLNGTSDMPWEQFPATRDGVEYPNVFAAFPDVQFYDYTKWPLKLRKVAGITNYSLTYSVSEDPRSEGRALDYLRAGHGIAVVFDTPKGKALPARFTVADGGQFASAHVIDGDASDLRFTDPRATVAGLRAKGRGKRDESGFVRAG